MTPLRHVMILASAGSGKTYALTNRFIDLLARGAAAERIVALTFTRKAAGEFFDEILNKLARAAREEALAAQLARELDRPELGAADFRRLLRAVVDAMPRLRLGTLDSFFARIARVFPLELGLAGDFEVMEEHAARLERQRVLRRMFTRVGDLDTAQREFIEAFKRATFGAEEKQLGRRLDGFLDAHQERYLEAADARLWGHPERIWPQGNAWLEAQADAATAAHALAQWLAAAGLDVRTRERWSAFLAAVAAWAPGMDPPRPLEYVLAKAIAAWPAISAGQAVLKFNQRKHELDGVACAALAALTRHVVGGELRRRLATTRGLHAVLQGYESVYHEAVRRAGKLTFGDVQRLLQPADGVGLSRGPGGDGRLLVDYRLDAEIDHWLLDEFQDTSPGQWSVLKNLIDEVVQDPAGTRSFFCVGDVKQAIFTWREGDPRLFREIFHHYNAVAPGAIGERHLVDSWRSGPPLIAMVNRVFGDHAVIAGLFPGDAAAAWAREWRPHRSAVPERRGQSALLLADNEAQRWSTVVGILRAIRPLERGLTCAVLVPQNAVATELADYLRAVGGFPAVAESDLHVCTDNPLGAALLALVQAAAHPGDTLAWEHVLMTPLGAVLAAEGITTREAATVRLLTQLHGDGFERTMEAWLGPLEARLAPGDAFSRLRARQFAAAAARYDQTGSRDVAEFVQFMERHVVRDPESAAVIRVMTIHKSKGLGFDVVILPDLQGKRIDLRREGLAVQKSADRRVEWVLDLPPKLFYEADDVLSRHVRAAEAEACYEALSLLYVALTRAKRGLYAIIEPVGDSVSRNYPKLLTETLGAAPAEVRIGGLHVPGLWSAGDPDWAAGAAAPAAAAAESAQLAPLRAGGVGRAANRPARRPSAEAVGRLPAARLFSLEPAAGAEFGLAVHALLAEVEWGAAPEPAAWRARTVSLDALAEARACRQAPELADVWQPRGEAQVWRERAFEIVLDGAWVTGVFDRVVLERAPGGAVQWVTMFDFKTDRIVDEAGRADAVQRYAPQLNLYRRVAAALAGVSLHAVSCELVFTHLRQRSRVPAGQIPALQPEDRTAP